MHIALDFFFAHTQGFINFVHPDFSVTSFQVRPLSTHPGRRLTVRLLQAYERAVTLVFQLQRSPLLVTVGDDDEAIDPTVKVRLARRSGAVAVRMTRLADMARRPRRQGGLAKPAQDAEDQLQGAHLPCHDGCRIRGPHRDRPRSVQRRRALVLRG